MRLTVICSFISATVLQYYPAGAQNKELISWGVEGSLGKYTTTQFNKEYIYINQLGSIPVNNARVNALTLTGDINFFVHLDKGDWEMALTGGVFSEKEKLTKDQ
ncbi:MAG: hypothetical protein ABI203_05770, partial [Mucilaginibacter sp.]